MKLVLATLLFYFSFVLNTIQVLGRAETKPRGMEECEEYVLDIGTSKDNENTRYYNGYLDGLESHMLYSKSGSKAVKVTDGEAELWTKGDQEVTCSGVVLTYQDDRKKLLILKIRTKSLLDPFHVRFYKYADETWVLKNQVEYGKELAKLASDRSNGQKVVVDVSSHNDPAGVSKISETFMGVTGSNYLPDKVTVIRKVVDAEVKVWEANEEGRYAVFVAVGKSEDKTEKVAFLVVRTSEGYEKKFFVVENGKWKDVNYLIFMGNIVKTVGGAMLRGKLNKMAGNGKAKVKVR